MAVRRPAGFVAFTVLWFGQLLSALGTRMTNFALSIWLWQQTGSATDLALLMFSAFLATVLVSPIAGSLIDRWNRRLTILLSDAGSGIVTGALLLLFLTGSQQTWHLFAANALTGGALAFQLPAYSSTISLMMEKGNYPRANAMLSLVRFGPAIFAPSLAAYLLGFTSISTVLVIDVLSYGIAVATVFLVRIPATPAQPVAERTSVWRDTAFGFRYIVGSRPLVYLEGLLFSIGLLAAMGYAMIIPLILGRTGSDTQAGIALSIGAIGGVLGAVAIGALPPTRDKMFRILVAIGAFSIVGRVLFGVAQSLVFWAIAMFVLHLCIPFIDGYGQAIWQEKVRPAVQGRVFAARQFIENLAVPVGLLVAGPVVDHVFEPEMAPGGGLAPAFGWLVGTGPGAGMGLLCVTVGVLGVGVAAAGFAIPTIRRVETLLPDHDEVAAVPDSFADRPGVPTPTGDPADAALVAE